jgi:adenylate cyclase class IV
MIDKNLEIEYKYSANLITVDAFMQFCAMLKYKSHMIVTGYDHFYSNPREPSTFFRHRYSSTDNQLTFKIKLVKADNYIREEHNIPLRGDFTPSKVEDFCNAMGFAFNSTIFKHAFIYTYPSYSLCYYIVYNENMEELGRFIEIEMKEDYAWSSREEAVTSLNLIEKLCKPLGVGPLNRVKKSLFELYGNKETKS